MVFNLGIRYLFLEKKMLWDLLEDYFHYWDIS
jgi:hypothetical protein